MDEQRWFRDLLDVCRSELRDAESGRSPRDDDYVVELRVIIQGLERRLSPR